MSRTGRADRQVRCADRRVAARANAHADVQIGRRRCEMRSLLPQEGCRLRGHRAACADGLGLHEGALVEQRLRRVPPGIVGRRQTRAGRHAAESGVRAYAAPLTAKAAVSGKDELFYILLDEVAVDESADAHGSLHGLGAVESREGGSQRGLEFRRAEERRLPASGQTDEQGDEGDCGSGQPEDGTLGRSAAATLAADGVARAPARPPPAHVASRCRRGVMRRPARAAHSVRYRVAHPLLCLLRQFAHECPAQRRAGQR